MENRMRHQLTWLWSVMTPLSCLNPKNFHTLLVELFRGNSFAAWTRFPSHSAIPIHRIGVSHQFCTMNETLLCYRSYCTINRFGIYPHDYTQFTDRSSINCWNWLNRARLLNIYMSSDHLYAVWLGHFYYSFYCILFPSNY